MFEVHVFGHKNDFPGYALYDVFDSLSKAKKVASGMYYAGAGAVTAVYRKHGGCLFAKGARKSRG